MFFKLIWFIFVGVVCEKLLELFWELIEGHTFV